MKTITEFNKHLKEHGYKIKPSHYPTQKRWVIEERSYGVLKTEFFYSKKSMLDKAAIILKSLVTK